MSPIVIFCIVFACIFGVAILAMFLGRVLPEHHLSGQSKEVINLGMALIATLAALVLGLMIATTQGTFNEQNNTVKQLSTDVILLDRVLARYGPETKEARDLLHRSVTFALDQIWPKNRSRPANLAPGGEARSDMEICYDKIAAFSPRDNAQRALQARALQIIADIAQVRLQLFVQEDVPMPLPFLILLVFWLMILFGGYGLMAPRNATVLTILFLCTLSASGALFLILELGKPFEGVMRVSSAPLHDALAQLGR